MNPAKTKRPKSKRTANKRAQPKKKVAPPIVRAFRFNAAQTVQIRFPGAKKPESFRIDDMLEASLVTLDGEAKSYFQYRLISNDKTNDDGSERIFWFFDAKPVGADPIGASLWRPIQEQALEGYDVARAWSGNFSTRSVTSYDGAGSRHVVELDGKPSYRMRLDLNGRREFGESLNLKIEKNDVLAVSES